MQHLSARREMLIHFINLTGNKMKIYIVEDHDDMRSILKRTIKRNVSSALFVGRE